MSEASPKNTVSSFTARPNTAPSVWVPTSHVRRRRISAAQAPSGNCSALTIKSMRIGFVGIVGLGAGTLTCYAKSQQDWTFYELDPLVKDIASDPDYFTYISQCYPKMAIKVGDARLSLQKEPDHKFDLFVIDAFSSDAIPTHLLTQEAIKLYFDKIKPNGILALHITNRHLALKNVLADHAKQLNLSALMQEFKPQSEIPLVVATDWVVMAKAPETLDLLRQTQLGNWQKLPISFASRPWTDDFTNIVTIWK